MWIRLMRFVGSYIILHLERVNLVRVRQLAQSRLNSSEHCHSWRLSHASVTGLKSLSTLFHIPVQLYQVVCCPKWQPYVVLEHTEFPYTFDACEDFCNDWWVWLQQLEWFASNICVVSATFFFKLSFVVSYMERNSCRPAAKRFDFRTCD